MVTALCYAFVGTASSCRVLMPALLLFFLIRVHVLWQHRCRSLVVTVEVRLPGCLSFTSSTRTLDIGERWQVQFHWGAQREYCC